MPSLARRYWSVESRAWDRALADPEVMLHIDELAFWLHGAAPGGAVIDLGCGTGNHSLALVAAGRSVIGVDFAPGMLAKAQAKLDGHAVALAAADLTVGLPIATGSLAGALSVYSLQFVDPSVLLPEIRRVLGPDGCFLLEVPIGGPSRRLENVGLAFRSFRLAKRAVARAGLMFGLVAHHSEDSVRAELERAGFTVLDRRETPRSYTVLARAV